MAGGDGRRRWVVAGILVATAELALYRLWPLIDDNDPPPSLEQQLALAAALTVLVLPHVIAWLGRRERPWLLTVAGGLGVLLTLVSIMGFTLILFTIPFLLVPSVVYLMRGKPSASPPPGAAVLFLFTALLCALAVGSLFLTEDPRCSIVVRREGKLVHEKPRTCDPYNSGRLGADIVSWSGSSDTIALHESLLSLALSGAVIVVCIRSTHSETRRPTYDTSDGAVRLEPTTSERA